MLLVAGCSGSSHEEVQWPRQTEASGHSARVPEIHPFEKTFLEAGLVDIHSLDSSILVDLRYGTTRNFLKKDFYQGFNKCFLQETVAQKLRAAQEALKQTNPELALLVWDAARPRSVQKEMWRSVKPPPGVAKGLFVSNPGRGSLHNFGCAVDVTLATPDGHPLDMGTDFDHFGREAWPVKESEMLKDAKLTRQQVTNRQLLRSVMYKAGFWNIQTEWWHFNAMRREAASQRFRMIE